MSELPVTKGERVAEAIRTQIKDGTLKPGDRLPSTSELTELYDCGIGVIRDAVRDLVAEGWIRTVDRVARYVADSPPTTV